MYVFWAKGYEGAALSDLTRAMRINRPSLYAAFGNKEQLFRKVLDRYVNGPLAYFGKALAAPKARDVIKQILLGAADMASDPRLPSGCLMVQGALACGDSAGSVQKETAARRDASEVALRRRLQRAKRDGDLPRNAHTAELARYVMTVLQGMAVQGAGGASSDELRRVAQVALGAWPSVNCRRKISRNSAANHFRPNEDAEVTPASVRAVSAGSPCRCNTTRRQRQEADRLPGRRKHTRRIAHVSPALT